MVLIGLAGERGLQSLHRTLGSSQLVRATRQLAERRSSDSSAFRVCFSRCRRKESTSIPRADSREKSESLCECAQTVRRNRNEVLHLRGKLLALLLPPCSATMTLDTFCELRSTLVLLKARPFHCPCLSLHFRLLTHALRPSRHI